MRVLLLILSALLATTADGQTAGAKAGATKAPAPTTQPDLASLAPSSLRTQGLNFGDDLMRLYVGDFSQLAIAREGTEFSMLVSAYMTTFSRQCAGDLPPDKVEIMTQECARESWTVNGYGVEQPGSRHCVSYRTVGTGRFADPEVYKLHKQLDAAAARAMVGGLLGSMKPGSDPTSGMRRMTDVAVYARNDMHTLVQANGCASPGLKRLQANLIRFGQGKDPIVMPGAAAAMAERATPVEGPRKDQNYVRLVDDLVTEQSQAWMMNRYQPGSVRPGTVTRDAQGRPREIVAGYSYVSMSKTYAGRVRVTFVDGAPQCLYFSDLPESCRVPSPRLVSAYRKNQYADGSGPDPTPRPVTVAPPVAQQPDVTPPAQARAAARPDPAEDPVPPVAAAASMPASAPDPAPAQAARETTQAARAPTLPDRQAAARERHCAALRSGIDKAREAMATLPPQRAQRAEPQIARMELSYTQQCGR